MNYVLGLDVGITSVGWAVLELNSQDDPIRIVDLNSRIFEKAENPKNGESLALPRRQARSIRRLTRRRRFRLQRVRRYIVRSGILNKETLHRLYNTMEGLPDIYELRYRGLTQPLSAEEWSRLLIFFAKHRGFKSNRKNASDGDDGEMLSAVKANQELLKSYRTVGEMLYKNEKFKECKHNKGGSYAFTVSRAMLKDEIRALFEVQRQLGQAYATEELEKEYIEIFGAQRNFDEGPGAGSPYGGDQIEKMIGTCTFEPMEKRAPKASYGFMAFNLWQKINHLGLIANGVARSFTAEEKQQIADLAWSKNNLHLQHIRKELRIPEDTIFSGVNYGIRKQDTEWAKQLEEVEKKQKFNWLTPYHEMRVALDAVKKHRITELSPDQIDTIAYAFTVFKNDEKITSYLRENGIEEDDIRALLSKVKGFSKFGHLSLKACYKILPYLEEGNIYSKACELAGYDFRSSSQEQLEDIPNPVVKRAISQTLKVIKAIVRRYGNPVEVHIELARELARNFEDRRTMQKSMEDNQKRNEEIKERLVKEYNVLQPTGMDIVKFKLYEEQQGACAYSQKMFDVNRVLHDPSYSEVDHIIPYSRSFDDSYNNKVLVLTKENRDKGNRTPMEYLKDNPARIDAFTTWVNAIVRNSRKRANLLKSSFTEDAEQEWKRRHLQDTQYISRFLYNYLRQNLPLKEGFTNRKRRIIPVNGAVTSYVRKRLGIAKIRENGDLHHAVDAVIIACVTQGVIKRVSEYSKARELWLYQLDDGTVIDGETGEVMTGQRGHKQEPFPEPWPEFRHELEARVSENPPELLRHLQLPAYEGIDIETIKTPFVSRMPNRKVKGQAHEETIRSGRLKDEGYTVTKVDLKNLKLKNGEIEGYYNPDSDRLLYNALKQQLEAYDGKGDKAFAEPFHKPKADGTPGPIVKKVKIMTKSNLNVPVNGGKGVADNGSMVRIDVFGVEERGKTAYYFVPIYVADTVKKILPNKASVAFKPYGEWKEMDEKDFLFSLYSNDLIYVESKRDISLKAAKGSTLAKERKQKEALVYYRGADIATASIGVVNDDNTYSMRGLGIKTLQSIRKCIVDVLGNVAFVTKEKRQGFR